MQIRRINDIQEVMKCLPFEREIRNKGRDDQRESKLLLFVQSQLQNPLFGFFMAYDDDGNVKGYIVTMASLIPGMERLHILRLYAKGGLMKEFEEALREWTKQFKLKIAVMTLTDTRMVKAMQRHYGYKVVSVNMERRYL
jgi:hypothetical protein